MEIQKPRACKPGRVRLLDDFSRGQKVLWISSAGGHLAELQVISEYLKSAPDSLWITFETPQAKQLLGDLRHRFVDYVSPRDWRGSLRSALTVRQQIAGERFDACISTGAAMAAFTLPMMASRHVRSYYIESLARQEGPSLTGRLLQFVPSVSTLNQSMEWTSNRWRYAGTVLDEWQTEPTRTRHAGRLRVVVSLGTIRPYRFDRAVDAVLAVLEPNDEVVWQLGATGRSDLPGMSVGEISPVELSSLVESADVVIAHAGVGSILQILRLGKSPLLAVRSSSENEHVDDHQQQLADLLMQRGLASVFDFDRPSRSDLYAAANRRIV